MFVWQSISADKALHMSNAQQRVQETAQQNGHRHPPTAEPSSESVPSPTAAAAAAAAAAGGSGSNPSSRSLLSRLALAKDPRPNNVDFSR